MHEGVCFWQHLSQGMGLKNSKGNEYVYSNPFHNGTEANQPILKIDQNSAVQGFLTVRPGGIYRYQTREAALDPQANAPIKPADMLALDSKMDDSVANSGNVYNYRQTCCGGDSSPICEVSGVYQTANSYACTPVFKIGGTNNVSFTK